MIHQDEGDIAFSDANAANVPVDIWLNEEDEYSEVPGRWRLHAGNYQPRRGIVVESAFDVTADTREELLPLIREHIIPLYETALRTLNAICEGRADNLYYWDEE